MSDLFDKLFNLPPEPSQCKGVFFRANVSNCPTKTGFLYSIRLVQMKRLSCPGCEDCGWIHEQLHEAGVDWPIVDLTEAQHGKLYTFETCNIERDWETNQVDQWDLRLVEVEEHSSPV